MENTISLLGYYGGDKTKFIKKFIYLYLDKH